MKKPRPEEYGYEPPNIYGNGGWCLEGGKEAYYEALEHYKKNTEMAPKSIRFSHNWNNKLGCNCFTTLRLRNDKKHALGEAYDIYLKDKFLGTAVLESKRTFHASKINTFVAFLDTGYNVPKTQEIIRKMYKKDDPEMDFLLLRYVKRAE